MGKVVWPMELKSIGKQEEHREDKIKIVIIVSKGHFKYKLKWTSKNNV